MIKKIDDAKVKLTIIAAGDRLKVGGDILFYDYLYTVPDPTLSADMLGDDYYENLVLLKQMAGNIKYDKQACEQWFTHDTMQLLDSYSESLLQWCAASQEASQSLSAHRVRELTYAFAEQAGVPMKTLCQTVRVAITGQSTGIDLFQAMVIIGSRLVLRRMLYMLSIYHMLYGDSCEPR